LKVRGGKRLGGVPTIIVFKMVGSADLKNKSNTGQSSKKLLS